MTMRKSPRLMSQLSGRKMLLPLTVPDEVFMARELEENALKNMQGVVTYPNGGN
jgi:predicted N-acetyltransferase YhbS